jgi:hypothetical protein
MDKYDKLVFLKHLNLSEDEKQGWIDYFRHRAKEMERLCVIYNPDCGCEVDQFVVLDRYPMSQKIISKCPICEKLCLMEISNSIIFHDPISKSDYTIEDLRQMHITDTEQAPFIKAYIKGA